MSRLVLLGAGNLLMRDDGIGVRVAQELQNDLKEKDTEVVIGETDVSYCLDCLQPDDFVVLLDAMRMGSSPGSVCLLPFKKAAEHRIRPFAMHDMNLVDAIAAEYPDIGGYLIGIEPAAVEMGFELSECLQDQFGKICANVEELLQTIKEEYHA